MPTIAQRYDPAFPIDALAEHPDNPRRGDEEAIEASMAAHGFYGAVLVQESTRRIIAGNHRTRVARRRGEATVPVLFVDVDDDQARRLLLVDNRTNDTARYDDAELARLLADLAALDDGLAGTGFDDADLARLLAGFESPMPEPDNVPETAPPLTALGDVWQLGAHRVMCGDSTKRDALAALMCGEAADVMVTDPPYGVAFGGDGSKASIHGDLSQAAIPVAFAMSLDVLGPDARVYLFGGSGNWSMYAGLFDAHLRMQVRPIVWVKNGFVLRPNNYHSSFEMVYFGWRGKGGAARYWFGDRKQTDAWRVDRDAPSQKNHPTQKPVEVCAIPIRNSCPPGGLVYEPFAGSGSVLIAAESLHRRCNAMELDPHYVDVICKRWQIATGIVPVLERTGEPVSFVGT